MSQTAQLFEFSPRRDYLAEAMMDACGWEWETLTPSARGWLNKALAEIREFATPDQINLRAAEYRRRYERHPTPTALVKHWPALTPHPSRNVHEHDWRRNGDIGRYCESCGAAEYH